MSGQLKTVPSLPALTSVPSTALIPVWSGGVLHQTEVGNIGRALREVDVREFGVLVDGVTDTSSKMQEAFTEAKSSGLLLTAPAGTILIKNLAIGGGNARWGFRGAGKGATILKRVSGGTAINCGGSSVPFTLQDFTLDCAHSANPTGSSHGISIGLVSGVRVERVSVIDHYGSAIQFYDDAGTHRFFDNICIDCDASGSGGLGQDGFLFANMDRCQLIRCFATGQNGSPGYGIQLKNVCWDCHVTDCVANNCIALLACGSDNLNPGVERCTVKGMTGTAGVSTTAGYIGGRSQYNIFSNIAFDMAGGVGFAIRCQNDIGNSITGVVVKNVGASRSAVYMDQTSTDNYVELTHVENLNVTGNVVEFHDNSTRNEVILRRMTTPKVRTAGLNTEATFNSSVENSYQHDGFPMWETCVITSDTVTPRNMASTMLVVTGEGGVSDNLATITATHIGNRNKILAIKNGNSSPGTNIITVTTAGNIDTAGGVSFALDGRSDQWACSWADDKSKWGEIYRANNG